MPGWDWAQATPEINQSPSMADRVRSDCGNLEKPPYEHDGGCTRGDEMDPGPGGVAVEASDERPGQDKPGSQRRKQYGGDAEIVAAELA